MEERKELSAHKLDNQPSSSEQPNHSARPANQTESQESTSTQGTQGSVPGQPNDTWEAREAQKAQESRETQEARGSTTTLGSVGNVLRAFRHDHRISIMELQEKLDRMGYPIDISTLNKYESGSRRFPASFIPFAATVLQLSTVEQNALLDAYIAEAVSTIGNDYQDGKNRLEALLNKPS